jgi:hypothetical protein
MLRGQVVCKEAVEAKRGLRLAATPQENSVQQLGPTRLTAHLALFEHASK